MKYPMIREIPVSRDVTDVFGGYNHNLRIGVGEFYDMQNLTSSDYPVLSPRPRRGTYASPSNPQAIISKDELCYVDGKDIVIGNERIDMGLTVDEKPKRLVSMGNYLVIFPDKKYINVRDVDDRGDIDNKKTVSTNVNNFRYCTLDGDERGMTKSPAEPSNKDRIWVDTSQDPAIAKVYSASSESWVAIGGVYIKISVDGINEGFSEGDGVKLTGMTVDEVENQNVVLVGVGDGYIIIPGTEYSYTNSLTISREMPVLDLVVESGNRLWGCRYGTALNGEFVNEIYASKLGDFKNWNSFQGISTDSYVASVGTDGAFTGAITHLGYPLFFKEGFVHKVYGQFPANYQIQTTACRGVQAGCEKSLVIVNELLLYKSRSAVCAYDGSLPVEISSALGEISYHDAVAGALGNKYYISMCDSEGKWHLFVYDTAKRMWHREDNTHAMSFAGGQSDLYFIDASDKRIRTILGSHEKDGDRVKWYAETGMIGASYPDRKYVSRMDIRMSLDAGSRMSVSIQYDSFGGFQHLFSMTGTTTQSFSIPVRPRRCDHFRIRIEGVGDAKIYSICKTLEQGSDV